VLSEAADQTGTAGDVVVSFLFKPLQYVYIFVVFNGTKVSLFLEHSSM